MLRPRAEAPCRSGPIVGAGRGSDSCCGRHRHDACVGPRRPGTDSAVRFRSRAPEGGPPWWRPSTPVIQTRPFESHGGRTAGSLSWRRAAMALLARALDDGRVAATVVDPLLARLSQGCDVQVRSGDLVAAASANGESRVGRADGKVAVDARPSRTRWSTPGCGRCRPRSGSRRWSTRWLT